MTLCNSHKRIVLRSVHMQKPNPQADYVLGVVKPIKQHRIMVPQITDRKKMMLERVRYVASQADGHCLSEEYVDANNPMKFRCSHGHTWYARPADILRGTWCLLCANARINRKHRVPFEVIEEEVKKRNGKLLTQPSDYINRKIKLKAVCENGHNFQISWGSIKAGSWCRVCGRKNASDKTRLGITEASSLAVARGGKLISESYRSISSPLEWECRGGHRWQATFASVRKGTWCKQCSMVVSISENIVRRYLEELTGLKFPTCRPRWLLNKDGWQMELDGCNETHKVAFEHHGTQHYIPTKFYDEKALAKRQLDDSTKEELCAKNGVRLLVVRELFKFTSLEDLRKKVTEFAQENGLTIKENAGEHPIDIQDLYDVDPLERFREAVSKRSGVLKTPRYAGLLAKYTVRCAVGHEWEISGTHLLSGRWCPICKRDVIREKNTKHTIDAMQEIASKSGGKCLSLTYYSNRKLLEWECKLGHRWRANASNVLLGKWCAICARQKLADKQRASIEKYRKIAQSKGGDCLSREYINARSKLQWICKNGHRWYAPPDSIQSGRWCARCLGRNKIDLESVMLAARERGGICLTTEIDGGKSPVVLQCRDGHRWSSTGSALKSGRWCPECAKITRANKRKNSIEEMNILASPRNGRCVSKNYVNSITPLEWECEKGHRWFARPSNIGQGKWCPMCMRDNLSKKFRGTIDEYIELASQKGGKCVSTEYVNARTHLQWSCENGHVWRATPYNIKRGGWCPDCREEKDQLNVCK
jgi:hypothetical protein